MAFAPITNDRAEHRPGTFQWRQSVVGFCTTRFNHPASLAPIRPIVGIVALDPACEFPVLSSLTLDTCEVDLPPHLTRRRNRPFHGDQLVD